MGMLEALIVSALGRSPYDENVVESKSRESEGVVDVRQQYDDRGHPVNAETRMRIRDHVRASNEVMQAAGIIEETSAVNSREISRLLSVRSETEKAVGRLERGRSLLIVGVWGVLGLRRRIQLYKDYSEHSLFEVIRRERGLYSIPHILYSGLPVLVLCQVIEWGFRAAFDIPRRRRKPSSDIKPKETFMGTTSRVMSYVPEIAVRYFWLHCHTFSIQQQLNLVPAGHMLPTWRWFMIFSSQSPLKLPSIPPSLTLVSMSSWVSSLLIAAAPMALVYAYGVIGGSVSSFLYRPFYHILPRAVNKDHNWARDVDSVSPGQNPQSDEVFRAGQEAASAQLNTTNVNTHDFEPESHTLAPSPNPQSLEIQDPIELEPALEDDSSSDGEDHQMTAQTLITFDVEATDVSHGAVSGTMGTWSAELRSANDVAPQQDEGPYYKVTAVAMLPPLLAADAFSMVLSGIVMRPVEALMVRVLGHAYRGNLGMETGDMLGFGMKSLLSFSWQRSINLAGTVSLEMLAVGLTWGIVVVGYSALTKAFEEESSLDADVEIVPDD